MPGTVPDRFDAATAPRTIAVLGKGGGVAGRSVSSDSLADESEREAGGLTRRQIEVLIAYTRHDSAKEVAAYMGVGIRTVNFHMVSIHRILGTASVHRAIIVANELGAFPRRDDRKSDNPLMAEAARLVSRRQEKLWRKRMEIRDLLRSLDALLK